MPTKRPTLATQSRYCVADVDIPVVGAVASISDYRPTFLNDDRPVHHMTLHNHPYSMTIYLGLENTQQLSTLALIAPMLKYVPIAHALLVPAPDGTGPTMADINESCAYALAYMFHEQSRKKIPTTLVELLEMYQIDLTADAAKQSEPMKDMRRRGEVLASMIMSLYEEFVASKKMSCDEYEITYFPHVLALEEVNPWGVEVYMVPMVPRADVVWPDFGPAKDICRCGGHGEDPSEHYIEVYHRILSLMRYALLELDPKNYYDPKRGLGRNIIQRFDAQVAINSVRKIKKQQRARLGGLGKSGTTAAQEADDTNPETSGPAQKASGSAQEAQKTMDKDPKDKDAAVFKSLWYEIMTVQTQEGKDRDDETDLSGSFKTKAEDMVERDAKVLTVLEEVTKRQVVVEQYPELGSEEDKMFWCEEAKRPMWQIINAAGIPRQEQAEAAEELSSFIMGSIFANLVRDELSCLRSGVILDDLAKIELQNRINIVTSSRIAVEKRFRRISPGVKTKMMREMSQLPASMTK